MVFDMDNRARKWVMVVFAVLVVVGVVNIFIESQIKFNPESEKPTWAIRLLDGSNPDIDTSRWHSFTDQDLGFSIKYPDVWKVEVDGNLTAIREDIPGRLGAELIIGATDISETVTDEIIRAEIEPGLRDYPLSFAGVNAKLRIHDDLILSLLHDDVVITLREGWFNNSTDKEMIEAMLHTFHFVK